MRALLVKDQEDYAVEFLKTGDSKQAGDNLGWHRSKTFRISKLTQVKARIEYLQKSRSRRSSIDSDRIIAELAELGFVNTSFIFNADGTVISPKEWPENMARAVKAYEVEETFEFIGGQRVWTGYIKRVQFWDKTKCLELMGKHVGMFVEKVDVKHTMSLEQLIESSHESTALPDNTGVGNDESE